MSKVFTGGLRTLQAKRPRWGSEGTSDNSATSNAVELHRSSGSLRKLYGDRPLGAPLVTSRILIREHCDPPCLSVFQRCQVKVVGDRPQSGHLRSDRRMLRCLQSRSFDAPAVHPGLRNHGGLQTGLGRCVNMRARQKLVNWYKSHQELRTMTLAYGSLHPNPENL